MGILVQLVPLALLAAIVGLVAASFLRGRIAMPARPRPRPAKPRHLRAVDPKTMDRELNELLKRR
jgi:hypothetical protein